MAQFGLSAEDALFISKKYTEDTIIGEGAIKGKDGADGKSAYQSWLDLGNTGTEEDFINSLKGEKGKVGEKGETGNNGKSAYEIWLDNGNVGTEQDFLDSLKGEGTDGFSPVITENSNNTDEDYRLDIETKESKFTTPNLKADIRKNIAEHNTSLDSHNDIRIFLNELNNRLNALANSDDETLDEMKEVVAYIKDNRSLIESITTTKVNVADIIDNLTTNVSNKPLSASQGVVIKNLIDTLQSELTAHANNEDIHVTASEKTNWNNATDKINNLEIADVNGLQTIADNSQTTILQPKQAGWYRIAEYIGGTGSSANSCELFIKRSFDYLESESHKIMLQSKHNMQEFVSILSDSKDGSHVINKIRYVRDSSKAYIDVYYNYDKPNLTSITICNGLDGVRSWKIISSPYLVAETIEGETVSTVFDIPANANPVTDLDLKNKLDKNVVDVDTMRDKTITDLRSALNSWISTNSRYPNSRLVFYGEISSIVSLWNSNNLTDKITGGRAVTVEIDTYYGIADYMLLKFTTYSSKEVYYVAKVNGEWGKIYKVAFTDDLTIDAIQGLRAELDELRSLITNS